MTDLVAKVVLTASDKGMGQTLKGLTSVTARFNQQTQQTQAKLAKLKNMQQTSKDFAALSSRTAQTSKQLAQAKERTAALGQQISKLKKPNAKLQQQFDGQRAKLRGLNEQYQGQQSRLNDMRQTLGNAAGSSRRLQAAQARLKRQIQSTQNAIQGQQQSLDKYRQSKDKLASKASQAKSTALWGLGLGTAGGALFYKTFVKTAAQFEDFETVLVQLEGSSAKAKQSMQWISDFATRTPFELDTVTDSFVKLRSYGLNPMQNGLLETLGDTAASMNKPITQAVEAIADAVTGENERLKEFGIKARTVGNQIVYEYSKDGQTMRKAADKSNRAAIQSTLQAIWNEKYAGAMKKRSKTFNGMLSNVSDQWVRFRNLVMSSGLFDKLKDKLEAFLNKINAMAADGSLQKWAQTTGEKLERGLTMAWHAGSALFTVLTKVATVANTIANAVGGWEVVIYAVIGAKFISWAVASTTALLAMAAAARKAARYTRQIQPGGSFGGGFGFDMGAGRKGRGFGGRGKLGKLGSSLGKYGSRAAVPLAVLASGATLASSWMDNNKSTGDKLVDSAGVAGGAAGAWGGAAGGAAIGTMILPGVGTAIGGAIGGALGYFGGEFAATEIANSIKSVFSDDDKQMQGKLQVEVSDTRTTVKIADNQNLDMDVSGMTLAGM